MRVVPAAREKGVKPPERICRDDAAAILGVPGRTVIHLAAAGRIPGAAKIGRRWTFDEKALRAWVRSREDEAWAKSDKPRRAATRGAPRYGAVSRSAAGSSDQAYEQMMQRLLRGG